MAIKKLYIVLGAIIVLIFLMSAYTVQQGHSALVMRLGKLERTGKKVYIAKPGLHLRVPLISSVRHFDMRLQTMDVDSSRILTAEQKYVLVDYYIKWRIKDLSLYYKRTGGFAVQAELLLKQKINDTLRTAFGRRTISEVVSSERSNVMKLLKQRANDSAQDLGIQVVDVRIRGIDLPDQVRESVFARMRTERERVATKYRAQGKAQAEAIRAKADADVLVTIANAKTNAAQIRAKGDQEAASIYANAYNQNIDFYRFYQSLYTYQQTLGRQSVVFLKPGSGLLKYFQ